MQSHSLSDKRKVFMLESREFR